MKRSRLVIITGGTGGLGQALASRHLQAGDLVIVTGRSQGKLDNLQTVLGNHPCLHTYQLDVTENDAVESFAAWVDSRYGSCDFLYNNAGTAVFKPFVEMSIAELEQTIATNVSGLMYVTRALLPMMLKARQGQIVQIASLAGRVATAKAAVYAASKAAVIRFSEGLQHELVGSGVFVTCVMPGPIDTPFLDRADASGQYRDNVRGYLLTTEYAARIIIKAAEAKQPEVSLPFRLSLLSLVYSLLPHRVKRLLAPILNRK